MMPRLRKYSLRLAALLLLIPPLAAPEAFYRHFTAYLSGNIVNMVIIHQWRIVVLSIVLFTAFLIPLSYHRRVNWAEYGLVGAFFISLFVEMYGIPLTILLASKYLAPAPAALPANVIEFQFLGVGFGMDLAMAYAAALIIIGAILIIAGWLTLYLNLKREPLVTKGVYALSRHPQYLGFILIISAWFIGWPTWLSLAFTPILVFMYLRNCLNEDRRNASLPGYDNYRRRVAFLI